MQKLQLEKNNFIRNLSQEQFDLVITNKYKKVFLDYFDGKLSDSELAKKIESNLDLIGIYEDEKSKIDPNQYLYSAIVDVALNYYNVANVIETCINKMELLASMFQLIALAESKMEHLEDLIYDVCYVKTNFDSSDEFINKKLVMISDVANSLDEIIVEITKHVDVVSEVEKTTKHAFLDEIHINESIKELYNVFMESFDGIDAKFNDMKESYVDELTGLEFNIMDGKLI